MNPRLAGVYAVLDAEVTADCEELLAALLPAGILLFQYRAKGGIDRGVLRRLAARTRAAGALLLVNDDPGAAEEADGLHVGQEDLLALGPERIRAAARRGLLGISAHSPREAVAAEALGASYLGVGPFAQTQTKGDAGEILGLAGISRVAAATVLPVAAIGGIGEGAIGALRRNGARMVAVVSALARAPDPAQAARRLIRAFAEAGPA